MGRVAELRCVSCQKAYAPEPARYVCDACGPLRGTLEVRYDYPELRRRLSRQTFAGAGHHGH